MTLFVIDMIAEALLPEVSRGHYTLISTEFLNKSKCDVIYAPHNPFSNSPPILIEV